MGRIRKLLLPLLAALAFAVVPAGAAFAANNTKNVNVSGTNNRTIYEAGSTVLITGTINGDVFCAGQTVTVDAQVNGDVICAAQTINLNGVVSGNVRLAGQSVNINGKIEKNASLAGQNVTLTRSASVGGDMGIAAQSGLVDGNVGRDVNAAATSLTVNSTVGRNMGVHVHQLTLNGDAKVNGSIDYTSNQQIDKSSGAFVAGKITRHTPAGEPAHRRNGFAAWLWGALFWLAFFFLLSLALVLLFPAIFRRWNTMAVQWPWRALLVGFLATIVGPVLFTVLMLTVIGVPIGLLYLFVSIVLAFLALPFAAYWLGDEIFRHRGHVLLTMIVGVIVLGLISLIPFLGTLVMILAFWFGLGMLLMNLWRLYPRPHYTSVPVKHVQVR